MALYKPTLTGLFHCCFFLYFRYSIKVCTCSSLDETFQENNLFPWMTPFFFFQWLKSAKLLRHFAKCPRQHASMWISVVQYAVTCWFPHKVHICDYLQHASPPDFTNTHPVTDRLSACGILTDKHSNWCVSYQSLSSRGCVPADFFYCRRTADRFPEQKLTQRDAPAQNITERDVRCQEFWHCPFHCNSSSAL